jgi:hypothetical protein
MKNIFLLSVLLSTAVNATICKEWSAPLKNGVLNHKIVGESSGLEMSSQFADRLYHVNDSGDGGYFYISDSNGSNLQKIVVADFNPMDVEDLTMGKCPGLDQTCLIIADIGDNLTIRSHVQLVFIEEKSEFAATVVPVKILNVRYPDGAHNAEAIAMHPNGDLYILTKEMKKNGNVPQPARLYVLSSAKIQQRKPGELEFEFITEIDLPQMLSEFTAFGKIVTGLDIHPSGKHFIILTYEAMLEVAQDLSQKIKPPATWVKGTDYIVTKTMVLPQQEAITYDQEGKRVIYSTEHKKNNEASLWSHSCR